VEHRAALRRLVGEQEREAHPAGKRKEANVQRERGMGKNE
jgi:hypothetical protein